MTTQNPLEQEQPFVYSPVEITRALIENPYAYIVTPSLEGMNYGVEEMELDGNSPNDILSQLSKTHPEGLFVLTANGAVITTEVSETQLRLHLFRVAEFKINQTNTAIAEHRLGLAPEDPYFLSTLYKKSKVLKGYQQQLLERASPTPASFRK